MWKRIIECLSNCHCRWLLVSKCCKSQCMSDFEEYPHSSPEVARKKGQSISLV